MVRETRTMVGSASGNTDDTDDTDGTDQHGFIFYIREYPFNPCSPTPCFLGINTLLYAD